MKSLNLTQMLIIAGSLFALGIIVQCATKNPATNWDTMKFQDYVYLTFYLSGLLFIPVYAGISNLFNKKS